MAFIMDFMENFIRQHMEDPKERTEKWVKHVTNVKQKAEELKETWRQPTKPYGYWNTDKNNFKFHMNSKFDKQSGRENAWDKIERSQKN